MTAIVHLREPMVEGKHFRRLSAREGGGRYRFALLDDLTYIHPHFILPLDARISFRDQHHHEWMQMTCRTQTIRKDYWWNGNTPKWGFSLFGRSIWLGTPDFPGTIPASGKHDPDFQFNHCEHFPFSWEAVNDHYYQIARANGHKLAAAFKGALMDFSRPGWEAAKKNGCYSVMI